jgi:hypothetical protein
METINEYLNNWKWNESLAQWERGDFRVVKYDDGEEIYYRLRVVNPEFDRSAPLERPEFVDSICQTIALAVKEQLGIELNY